MLKRLGLVLLFLGIGNYSFSQSVSWIPNGSVTGITSNGTSTTFTVPLLLPDGTVSAPSLALSSDADGTGTGFYRQAANVMSFAANGVEAMRISGGALTFNAGATSYNWDSGRFYAGHDLSTLGLSNVGWQGATILRFIQGSKSKTLTESSATSFTQVAVPQTAGANHAAGKVIYEVYATDGTDTQSLAGEVYFSAVNKAGTETCSIGLVGTEVLSVSTASTLTCTHTCVTGLTDVVQIASNCVSSLVQTTFTIQSRLDMPQPNTVTPQ